jgi:acyl-CoA synthetase (AMP-forming)/AMP-acid ligase II
MAELRGLMMDLPLSIGSIIDHAAERHADVEVVTRRADGSVHRYTYADVRARSAALAHALLDWGIRQGDRVGTIAWNSDRHLELYYGISGIGAVVHTINPRLFADQIAYVIEHARDRMLFIDAELVPLVEALGDKLPHVETCVILADAASMPATKLPNAIDYETFLRGKPRDITWPTLDENSASSLCYTSGTTGNPKGVLYSHRSTVLHALSGCASQRSRRGSYEVILPVVPMFHVNAWGLPYVAPMLGAKLVLPGPRLDPASVYELFENEAVEYSAGVPTVWAWLLAYVRAQGLRFSTLRALGVGGSAVPASMIQAFENDYGVEMLQGWGMTETSPVCSLGILKRKHEQSAERIAYRAKAGRFVYGVQTKIVDDAGNVLPRDGVAQGELLVRGPWVASSYFDDPEATEAKFTADGWLRTGDIVSIDPDGYLTIRDRSKDVIKSGGEWISSIDLENVAVAHPDVAEAAAIGVPHPVWSERPILVVIPKPETKPDRASILAFLDGKIASWWMPDDVVFVDDLPHTATGKVSKMTLRERLKDYQLPATPSGKS